MTKATLIDGKGFSNGLVERVGIAAGDLASRIGPGRRLMKGGLRKMVRRL